MNPTPTRAINREPWTAGVTAALIRAGRAARRLAEETGTPFIVMVDVRIVDLNAPKARRKRRAKRSK